MKHRALKAALVLALGLTALVIAGAAASASTTIGQTAFANEYCGPAGGIFFQTAVSSGTPYTVPAGNWTITSWSADGGIFGGQMSLNVFRAVSPGTYSIVAESAVETLQPFVLNTFETSLPVQQGDIVGIWAGPYTSCASGIPSSADTFAFQPGISDPPVGTVLSGLLTAGFSRIDVSAVLTQLPTSIRDCLNGNWQSYGVFKNEGDCVSFVASGGTNLPG